MKLNSYFPFFFCFVLFCFLEVAMGDHRQEGKGSNFVGKDIFHHIFENTLYMNDI